MSSLYAELQWLPRVPEEFTATLKAFASSSAPVGGELQALASYGLDLNQLTKLAKAIAKARGEGKDRKSVV